MKCITREDEAQTQMVGTHGLIRICQTHISDGLSHNIVMMCMSYLQWTSGWICVWSLSEVLLQLYSNVRGRK